MASLGLRRVLPRLLLRCRLRPRALPLLLRLSLGLDLSSRLTLWQALPPLLSLRLALRLSRTARLSLGLALRLSLTARLDLVALLAIGPLSLRLPRKGLLRRVGTLGRLGRRRTGRIRTLLHRRGATSTDHTGRIEGTRTGRRRDRRIAAIGMRSQ